MSSFYLTLEFNSGDSSETIQGAVGEPFYTTDTNQLLIGNGSGTAPSIIGGTSFYGHTVDTSSSAYNYTLAQASENLWVRHAFYHSAHTEGNNLIIHCTGSDTFDGSSTAITSSTTGDYIEVIAVAPKVQLVPNLPSTVTLS